MQDASGVEYKPKFSRGAHATESYAQECYIFLDSLAVIKEIGACSFQLQIIWHCQLTSNFSPKEYEKQMVLQRKVGRYDLLKQRLWTYQVRTKKMFSVFKDTFLLDFYKKYFSTSTLLVTVCEISPKGEDQGNQFWAKKLRISLTRFTGRSQFARKAGLLSNGHKVCSVFYVIF